MATPLDAMLKKLMFGAKFAKNNDKSVNPQEKRKIEEPSDKPAKKKRKRSKVAKNELIDTEDFVIFKGSKKELNSENSNAKEINQTPKKVDKSEKVLELRRKHKIFVAGTDVPDPCTSFEQMQRKFDVPSKMLENLTNLKMIKPTPIQMQAIPAMLGQREVMASAPTGSGKTLAFALPILTSIAKKNSESDGKREPLSPLAIVLEPTRELARQTFHELMRFGDGLDIKTHLLEKVKSGSLAIKKRAKHYDIVVTTPNRLIYDMQAHPPRIMLNKVEWLIVDESDKLFEFGNTGFREQLGSIYVACESSAVRRCFFSATFSFEVEEWCGTNLDNVLRIGVGLRNSAVDSVEQDLIFVGSEAGKITTLRKLIAEGLEPPVLMFVQSKDRVDQLFAEIEGLTKGRVAAIHSQMPMQKREESINAFRDGSKWFLIATELLGRGVDFKGVNVVINWDFPTSAISYIHRIGRTGRAGRKGKAITFFTENDKAMLRSIAFLIKQAGCPVPDYMLQLNKLNKKAKKKLEKHAPKREKIRKRERFGCKQKKTEK